jgi:FkbM family methyltransferase
VHFFCGEETIMKILKTTLYYIYSMIEMVLNIRNWPSLLPIFLGKNKSNEQTILLRRPSLKMVVRGKMDIWSVKETFLDAFYTRYGVPVQDGWQVVDIGAGIGDFSIKAAYNNPNTVVYAFEPFPSSYALLLKNIEINGIKNVVPSPQAVWSHEGSLVLDLSLNEPLKISSREEGSPSDIPESINVGSTTLTDLIAYHDIDKVDLIKLDCEGAEYEILMSTPHETLVRVKHIIMEYHDIDDMQNHHRLVAFLESQGFDVKCHRNYVHDEIGYLFARR